MSRTLSLDQIQIPSPCPKRWEEMRGDAKVRFCDECEMRVFNLSEITRDEAQALLDAHPDRLCVCYRPTEDGKVRTLDYQAVDRRRSRRWWIALASLGGLGAAAIQGILYLRRPTTPAVTGMMVGDVASRYPITTTGKPAPAKSAGENNRSVETDPTK